MLTHRPSAARGHVDHGWLDTHHTFSFADYHDPHHLGFRDLRVINEDVVAPGKGFGRHGHRDMEILTWVLSGTLEHQDSLGTRGLIAPGEIQRMSAGTGIQHSEANPSQDEPVHLLQIWILPERGGLPPSYEQRAIPADERRDRLCLAAAPDGEGAVAIHQDVRLHVGSLAKGKEVSLRLAKGRHGWVQVARGAVSLEGGSGARLDLAAGDGAAASDEGSLRLVASDDSEVLVFDLA